MSKSNKSRQVRFRIANDNYARLKAISPLQDMMSFNLDIILREHFKRFDKENKTE